MSKRIYEESVEKSEGKKIKLDLKRKDNMHEEEEGEGYEKKKQKFSSWIPSLSILPRGWNQFISKGIDPPGETSIVVYKPLEFIYKRL